MLAILFAGFIIPVSAQSMQFTITVNNKSLVTSAADNNTNNVFETDSKMVGDDVLTISVSNEEIAKDWKRSFAIYDSSDEAITSLTEMKNGSYSIKISGLKKMLSPDKDYFIYTTALPEDPQKAMLVKVARILVCTIKIR